MKPKTRRNILILPLLALWSRFSGAQMSGGLPPIKQNESNAKPTSIPTIKSVEPIKIAFVYVGPIGDGGWTYAHDIARKIVEQQFSWQGVWFLARPDLSLERERRAAV